MSQARTVLLGRQTWQIHGVAFEAKTGDPFASALRPAPTKSSATTQPLLILI
jgi:hypothetical protein